MKKLISYILALTASVSLLTAVKAQGDGIVNGDFSDGLNGWATASDEVSVTDGRLALNGSCTVKQIIAVENGVYDLSAELTNTNAAQNAYIYAKPDGFTAAKTAVPQYNSPTTVTVRGVRAENGRVEIGVTVPEGGITVDNVTLTPASPRQTEFLKGGEISKLTYIEDMGGKFRDAEGNERDALQIMAENGFNLARIRVLNNPGKGRGDGTYYLPEGYQNEEDCLEMARRAKDKGMKIQFTFAYSDYWSDGEKQYIPSEWLKYIDDNGITDKQALTDYLADRVYEYTKKVMLDLIEQDTVPDYVSIGNEMQYGVLFGHWQKSNGLYNTAGAKYQVQILNAGTKAVREASPSSKIILHSDNGGLVISKRGLFYNTFVSQVDCDIIGVSYYPFYNSSISINAVVNEFNKMIAKYDKDVMIMETGYNWSQNRGDGYEGQLKDNGYYQNTYGETKEGQHAFLIELYAKLKTNVTDGRCIADLYWDPVMLYDGGSYKIGWAVKESDDWADGNVVSNSNLFDFEGRALPSQEAMKYNTSASDTVLISGKITEENGEPVKNTKVTFTAGYRKQTVSTDAYGEYIVSAPYSDKIGVTAEGYAGSYYLDTPADDFIIKDVNFPAERNDEIPEPTETPDDFLYSPASGVVTLPKDISDGASVIAAFYKNGALVKTQLRTVTAGTKAVAVSAPANGETVKVFLWDGVSSMKPLYSPAKTY